MALGSLCEVETQLILAKELGFIRAVEVDHCLELAQETGRVLYGLTQSVSRSESG